ncbi:hypothetical protein MXF29_25430 [Pseudomonas sp. NC26]|nr:MULTISPECIES: hypothetical protein [Pseudomonas]MCZ9635904.1 hypothetical protein [Pseudomonas putida]MEC4878943.1 hypothetical protein [Pseudomonas sp. NC26]QNL89868.1 Uncharacterized protein PPKH_4454 [Pseudomonas putida]
MNIIDKGLIPAVIINLIIVTMTAQCFIAARRTEYFESLFPNSQYIKKNRATYERAGLIGKLMRTGTISTVLALPSIFTHKNLVEQQEIDSFPKKTKTLLVTLWALHITLFSSLVVTHYL